MHVVLRSTQAKGTWSFARKVNRAKVDALIAKFATRYGVRLHSVANAGNHIHLHIQLANRHTYRAFIRALTGSIAMAITGVSRWNPGKSKLRFWDRRPFSRVGYGYRAFLRLKEYLHINQLEGFGIPRDEAREMNSNPYHWVNYAAEFGSA